MIERNRKTGRAAATVPTAWMLATALLAGVTLLGGCQIPAETRAKNERERGMAAYNLGNYNQAKAHLQRSIEAKPTGFRQRYWMGRTELKLGRPVAAQSAFEEALSIRQDDSEWTPKILDGIAESLYQQGRVDALHMFLRDTSSRQGTTRAFLREAKYLVKTGDPDNAVVAFRKAAHFSRTGDPSPYIALAEFYEAHNNVPRAVEALRYAYYLDPNNREVEEAFRRFGIVPGPTLGVEPPKPQILD